MYHLDHALHCPLPLSTHHTPHSTVLRTSALRTLHFFTHYTLHTPYTPRPHSILCRSTQHSIHLSTLTQSLSAEGWTHVFGRERWKENGFCRRTCVERRSRTFKGMFCVAVCVCVGGGVCVWAAVLVALCEVYIPHELTKAHSYTPTLHTRKSPTHTPLLYTRARTNAHTRTQTHTLHHTRAHTHTHTHTHTSER